MNIHNNVMKSIWEISEKYIILCSNKKFLKLNVRIATTITQSETGNCRGKASALQGRG